MFGAESKRNSNSDLNLNFEGIWKKKKKKKKNKRRGHWPAGVPSGARPTSSSQPRSAGHWTGPLGPGPARLRQKQQKKKKGHARLDLGPRPSSPLLPGPRRQAS